MTILTDSKIACTTDQQSFTLPNKLSYDLNKSVRLTSLCNAGQFDMLAGAA